jgi:DNA polymerase (family 10)
MACYCVACGVAQVPGLGAKRVRALHEARDIQTLEELDHAARQGRIHLLPGFGEKTEERIIESIEPRLNKSRRFRLGVAAQYSEPLLEYLRAVPGVEVVLAAGSFIRMRDTVGEQHNSTHDRPVPRGGGSLRRGRHA